MIKKYKLDCFDRNSRHVKFTVFDHKGCNCGTLTVEAEGVIDFVKYSWNGDIFWNGKMPQEVELGKF